jgi:hypothetical protein
MKIKTALGFVFCILLSFKSYTVVGQDKKATYLDQKIPLTEVSRENASEILFKLASKFGVPIGLGVSTVEDNQPDGTETRIKAQTVKEVLDAVTTIHPDYIWSESDGVINVSARFQVDPLLDLVITDFNVEEKTVVEMKRMLSDKLAAELSTASLGIKISELAFTRTAVPGNPTKYSFSLRNKTVREIMNHIIRVTAAKYWTIVRWGPQNSYAFLNVE